MFPISLDREPVKVAFALSVAKKYYSEQDYLHALRVMQYVADNNKIPYEYQDECLSLAVMHDLLEDTEFTGIGLPENFRKALAFLTKPDDQDYITYIKNIEQTNHTNWRLCVLLGKSSRHERSFNATIDINRALKRKVFRSTSIFIIRIEKV